MFVITMAGLSSRFFRSGYTLPKYELPINDRTVFAYSVSSFKKYFETDEFLFIVRDVYNTVSFVRQEVVKLGIKNYHIEILPEETRGQAETAYLGLKHFKDDFPIYIFNIDTFRYNYTKPKFIDECDGYLEVFEGDGEHWSFILPDSEGNVIKTTEKQRISNLCSDGLYFFNKKSIFEKVYLEALEGNQTVNNEYYIAPLYNNLIENGYSIKYELIELSEIDFCGIPEEYEFLCQKLGR